MDNQLVKDAQAKRKLLIERGEITYSVNGDSITCLCCGKKSHHRHDVSHKYCSFCQEYHSEGELEAVSLFDVIEAVFQNHNTWIWIPKRDAEFYLKDHDAQEEQPHYHENVLALMSNGETIIAYWNGQIWMNYGTLEPAHWEVTHWRPFRWDASHGKGK